MQLLLNDVPFTCDVVELGGHKHLAVPNSRQTLAYVYVNSQVKTKTPGVLYLWDPQYATQVQTFLVSGLTVYRGVPRWHRTWAGIRNSDPMKSRGTGNYPDFDTDSSVYIPFTAKREVAVGAAISKKGMGDGGERDRIEFVKDYSKLATFPVGMVVRMHATRLETALGFFNPTEVQVRGPLIGAQYWIDETFYMGTSLGQIFGDRAKKSHSEELAHFMKTGERNDLSSTMPDVPTAQQVRDYSQKYQGLIP
jgi:hypothetical protein